MTTRAKRIVKSIHRGVSYNAARDRWRCQVYCPRRYPKQLIIGEYRTEAEAARAARAAFRLFA